MTVLTFRLGDIAEQITDGTHLSPNYVDSGIPMLDSKHIKNDFSIDDSDAEKFISIETDQQLALRCKPIAGDILISSRGTIGKIAIVKVGQNFNIMGNMILIRLGSSIDKRFFLHYLRRSLEHLVSLSRGVAQKGLYLNQVRDLIIKIPSLAEQKRIAELLDTADRILKQRVSAITKLDQLAQSVFVEMFGDFINNPNKWPVKKLGNFIEIVMGQAPHSDQCNKEGKGVVFVKAGEFGIDSPIIREWTIDPLKMAKANDILICVVGATAGKINRSRFECAIGRSVASVRSTSIELNQDYLHSFLKTKILELRNRSQGAAQAVITREMLQDIEIPLPPIAKQIEFVSFLKELRNDQNMFSISSKKMSQLQMSLQYQSFAVN
jgi:restriction endonuclease S subunit